MNGIPFLSQSSGIYRVLYILLIFCSTTGIAQESRRMTFGIYQGNTELGTIESVKISMGNTTKYLITSDARFRMIVRYHRTTDMRVEYRSGILHNSISEVYNKGKLDERSAVSREGYGYRCRRDAHDVPCTGEITFSASMLYFHEPKDIQRVFIEHFMEFGSIEETIPGTYRLTLPNNRANYYKYREGELQEVFVKRAAFSITFRKKT